MANISVSIFFYTSCISIATIFLFFNHEYIFNQAIISIQTETIEEKSPSNLSATSVSAKFLPNLYEETIKKCNLFEGEWIKDLTPPLYTNYSCKTMPLSNNCFLNGRKNSNYLHWRWRPYQCELPRFEPETFLSILRGKKMAFIGDSLARNQMESLLCLLSTVETPNPIERDVNDQFVTWEFPNHNFRLVVIWSQFLVEATEVIVNGNHTGTFNLFLDRANPTWSEKLPSLDYVVFSFGHWFNRPNNLYESGNFIGCTFHNRPKGPILWPDYAIRKAIRTTFKTVHECNNCKNIISFLTTLTPEHFENGEWYSKGGCNRTEPIERDKMDMNRTNWELYIRRIGMEEVEVARNGGNNEFEVVDVTEMMLVRADGHPDLHYIKKRQNGYRDCVHWCMPGPIDTWNELLLEKIKRMER